MALVNSMFKSREIEELCRQGAIKRGPATVLIKINENIVGVAHAVDELAKVVDGMMNLLGIYQGAIFKLAGIKLPGPADMQGDKPKSATETMDQQMPTLDGEHND